MTVSATTARRRKAAPPIHSRNRHSPSSADLPRLVTSPPSHHRRKHEDKLPVFHPDMQTARLLAVKNGARTLPDICFEVTSTDRLLKAVYTFNHVGWKTASMELYKRDSKFSSKWVPLAAWGYFAEDKANIAASPLWRGLEVNYTRSIEAFAKAIMLERAKAKVTEFFSSEQTGPV